MADIGEPDQPGAEPQEGFELDDQLGPQTPVSPTAVTIDALIGLAEGV